MRERKTKKTDNSYKSVNKEYTTTLSDYAYGLYTDIIKAGYGPEDIDDKLTYELQKGYINKKHNKTQKQYHAIESLNDIVQSQEQHRHRSQNTDRNLVTERIFFANDKRNQYR